MSHKCPIKVISDFFIRHLPTSLFFKLACLTSVVRFFPKTKYFHLWNTYFGRATWYSFQKNRTSVAPKPNASSWIFSLVSWAYFWTSSNRSYNAWIPFALDHIVYRLETPWSHTSKSPYLFPFQEYGYSMSHTYCNCQRDTVNWLFQCHKFTNRQALHCIAGISSSWMKGFFTIECLLFVHCLLRKGNWLRIPLGSRLVWNTLELLHHRSKEMYTKSVERRL